MGGDFFLDPVKLLKRNGGLNVGKAEIEPEVIEIFRQGGFDTMGAHELETLVVGFVMGDDKTALARGHQLSHTQ